MTLKSLTQPVASREKMEMQTVGRHSSLLQSLQHQSPPEVRLGNATEQAQMAERGAVSYESRKLAGRI